MGKKPFIIMAVGLLLVIAAFVFRVGDPTCDGDTMGPRDVCVNESSGRERTYEEVREEDNRIIRIGFPIVGGLMIAYGAFSAFVAFKARRISRTGQAQASQGATPPGSTAPPQLTLEQVNAVLARPDLTDAQRQRLEQMAARLRAGLPAHDA